MTRFPLLIAALGLLVVVSAIAVVEVKHQSRSLFVTLEALQDERDRLNTEWSRLRLEQGALATHSRVERIARESLDLRMPDTDRMIVIRSQAAGAGQ